MENPVANAVPTGGGKEIIITTNDASIGSTFSRIDALLVPGHKFPVDRG